MSNGLRHGDKVIYRMDDTNHSATVTHVHDDNTIDVVLHDRSGMIVGGIPEVKRAKTDHDKKTDGFWWTE